METQNVNAEALQAWFELIELNMQAWRPEVADWLHSEDSQEALSQLLAAVPCSPTVH